jgi:hypothetical protein
MFRRPRLFGLAAFLSVTGLAMASRVDTPFGSNTGFKDDSTQLVWLDLTLTSNHSYDYMVANLAPGGFFAGWRFATPPELARFFTDYDGGIVNDTMALNLMNDLGGPLVDIYNPQNGFRRKSSVGLLDVSYGLGHALYGYIAVDNFYGPSINPALQGSSLDSFGATSFGSWLVEAPEPGYLPIVAFLVCGIMLRFRKVSSPAALRPRTQRL